MNEILFVTIKTQIPYTIHEYEKTYFMNSEQAMNEFIERFNNSVDLSLNEIVRTGKAQFNKAGMLVER